MFLQYHGAVVIPNHLFCYDYTYYWCFTGIRFDLHGYG